MSRSPSLDLGTDCLKRWMAVKVTTGDFVACGSQRCIQGVAAVDRIVRTYRAIPDSFVRWKSVGDFQDPHSLPGGCRTTRRRVDAHDTEQAIQGLQASAQGADQKVGQAGECIVVSGVDDALLLIGGTGTRQDPRVTS